MTTEPQDDLDRQIKQLERDKRLEEVEQLRAGRKTRWVTPAALAALLPLVGGIGLWAVGEVKQYGEGYRALRERDRLRQEKDALQAQKDSLNIEITTLLQLKEHYAAQARRLEQEAQARQELLDRTYLRGVFTTAEALYALDHVKGLGPAPDRKVLDALKKDLKGLPKESAGRIEDVVRRYELAVVVIDAARDVVSEFRNTLKLIPASDWARDLQAMPSGSVIAGRSVMFTTKPGPRRYYDVTEGRYLTPEEAKGAH